MTDVIFDLRHVGEIVRPLRAVTSAGTKPRELLAQRAREGTVKQMLQENTTTCSRSLPYFFTRRVNVRAAPGIFGDRFFSCRALVV